MRTHIYIYIVRLYIYFQVGVMPSGMTSTVEVSVLVTIGTVPLVNVLPPGRRGRKVCFSSAAKGCTRLMDAESNGEMLLCDICLLAKYVGRTKLPKTHIRITDCVPSVIVFISSLQQRYNLFINSKSDVNVTVQSSLSNIWLLLIWLLYVMNIRHYSFFSS